MPVAPDLCGTALDGRYELHAVIGEGAFGRVYRGRDRRLDRAVAVKVIKPWWSEDPDWVGSFEREAQLLARVSDPGIVQIFDVGHAEEGLYYVSELVDGESLAARLKRGPVDAWEAAALAEQLCRALAHAHAQKIIHRDVKPANILLSAGGRVKVGDFGVARLAEGSSDGQIATVVGTPRYMAPEQGRGQSTSPATDVYSVGVVLYEMLAGEAPFTAGSVVELALAHFQQQPPPLPAEVPPELRTITLRALAKEPGDRYPDASQMARSLATARRGHRRIPARARAPRARTINGNGKANGAGAATAATRLLAPGRSDRTQVGEPMSRRRRWNPAARRRTVAVFAFVICVFAALVIAGVITGRHRRTAVPGLKRATRAEVQARAARHHLDVDYHQSYSATVPAGRVISQQPAPGRRVSEHTTVTVTLSRGPAPVTLPNLTGESQQDAALTLQRDGLQVDVEPGPDPDKPAGTVYGQSPQAGRPAPKGSTVTLETAETPRWQPTLTAIAGTENQSSVPFTIRGSQWRLSYTMSYTDRCSFLFLDFCSAPQVTVVELPGGQEVDSFQMDDGGPQTVTYHLGPGTYQVKVAPGDDSVRYSVKIQDWF